MKPHDELALLKAALRGPGECPSPQDLHAPSSAGHVAQCPRCQAERKLLDRFAAAPEHLESPDVAWIAARLAPPSGPLRKTLNPVRIRVASLAIAASLIVIAGGLYIRDSARPQLDPHPPAGVLRSGEIQGLAPAGDLDRVPDAFVWDPVPAAVRYEIAVLEVDGTELWKSASYQAKAALPAAVRAKIPPRKALLVRVVAFDSANQRIAESQPARFRIQP